MGINSHNEVINHSINWILNQSFDVDNQMLMFEPVGVNGSGGLERLLTVDGKLQVDIVSGTVGLSGTFTETNSGSIDAAVNSIDSAVNAAIQTEGDSPTTESMVIAGTTGSAVKRLKLNDDGRLEAISFSSGKTLKSQKFSLSSTDTVITAVASKSLRVYALKLVCSAAVSVKFRSGASTDLEDLQPYLASGGYTESVTPPSFLFETVSGESLDLVISGTGTVSGRVSYWEE